MRMEKNTFESLIKKLPDNLTVLDAGAGGLHGENTTDVLVEKFQRYQGVCHSAYEVMVYQGKREEAGLGKANIHIGEAEIFFNRKFNLVVLDLNIEANLEQWSDKFLEVAKTFVCKRGYLINYIMTDMAYGDCSDLIRKHKNQFWVGGYMKKLKSLDGWELVKVIREERRNEILWVLLRKK